MGGRKVPIALTPEPFIQAVYRMREAAVRILLFATGSAGIGDERAYSGGILAAGRGFNSRNHIDSPGAKDANGLGNIGRGKAARHNKAQRAVLTVLKQGGARR